MSAAVAPPAAAMQPRTAGPAVASAVGMLTAHVRATFRVFTRNVALSVVSIVMPVMLYAFIALGNAGQQYAPGVLFGAYFLASMAAYAVSAVMIFNFGATVAVERGQKVDYLLRASPLPPAIYLAARIVTALVFAVVALIVLFGFAWFVVGLNLPIETWLSLGGKLLLGSIPFIAIGFAIAYLAGPNAAVAIANITYLALAFASGIFIPFDQLPKFVQTFAPYLPTYHYAQLAWGAVGLKTESDVTSLAWLAGFAIAFLAIAAWAYRREEGRSFR